MGLEYPRGAVAVQARDAHEFACIHSSLIALIFTADQNRDRELLDERDRITSERNHCISEATHVQIENPLSQYIDRTTFALELADALVGVHGDD